MVDDSSSEFYPKVKAQLQKDLHDLRIHEASIKNKLATELNMGVFLVEVKLILKRYDKPISSSTEFPYKEFFSKIVIQNRNKIIFVIGTRTDYENISIPEDLFLPNSVSYKIRKTEFQSSHGIFFY